MSYGKAPSDLGEVHVAFPEVMYYLYLPIKLRGDHAPTLPANLTDHIEGLLEQIYYDLGQDVWRESYIYITVKKMFVGGTVTPNRPGWHADGFGGSDLNYIWYDSIPTEFSLGQFSITEGDHIKSLEEFEEQAGRNTIVTYPEGHLLKLDPYVVHRVAEAPDQVMRTFVKVSISKDQYNLKDNSINHELEYKWKTYDRQVVRNDPSAAQADSYKPTPTDDHFA